MAVVEYSPVTAPVEVLTEREKRARTLEAAALEGDMRGWCHSQIEDEAGRVCLVGAICKAQGYTGWDYYGSASQAWGPGVPMAEVAGRHDAWLTMGRGGDPYDPAAFLRSRASLVREGKA